MNTRILKRAASVLTVLCILCLTFCSTVLAAPDAEPTSGSITVVGEHRFEGVEFTLIEMADTSSGLVFTPEFVDAGIELSEDSTAAELMEMAEYARDYALLMDITGSVQTLDSDGLLTFSDLALNKVYLIFQSDGFDTVETSPIITALPYKDPDGNYNYDINVEVKQSDPAHVRYPGSIIITKMDDDDNPLEGAVFKLYIKDYNVDTDTLNDDDILDEDDNGVFRWKYQMTTPGSNENGQIAITGMKLAEYRLIEIEAPEGYQLDDTPQDFVLRKHSTVKFENGLWVPEIGDPTVIYITNKIEESVKPDEPVEPSGADVSGTHPSRHDDEQPEPSHTVLPDQQPDEPFQPSLTGDDIAKYIVIGGIVAVSLVVIILLVLVGGKKKDNNK